MTAQVFSTLDAKPGLFGYQGGWHPCIRRLRNNAPRELVRWACNAPNSEVSDELR